MSVKDSDFGPRARGVSASTVSPFCRATDAVIRSTEFPPFVNRALSDPDPVHDECHSALDALACELFRCAYDTWAAIQRFKGLSDSHEEFVDGCFAGMEIGAAKYGVDWPFCDNLTEAQAEVRDLGVYSFLAVLHEMLNMGALDDYKGLKLEHS